MGKESKNRVLKEKRKRGRPRWGSKDDVKEGRDSAEEEWRMGGGNGDSRETTHKLY
jgi:hypothetical protein